MSEQAKIVEKIRKLFALSKSPNQHEAEAALAKANALMQEHQLSMSEVEVKAEGGVKRDMQHMGRVRSRTKYVWSLAQACAEMYDCTTIKHDVFNGWMLSYIGRSSDIQLAKATFEYLYGSWDSIAKEDYKVHGDGANSKLFKNSHLAGFASAIQRRVRCLIEERKDALRKANTTGTALVLVKGQEVQQFVKDRFSNLKPAKERGSNLDYNGVRAGRQRGDAIPLSGAIGKE